MVALDIIFDPVQSLEDCSDYTRGYLGLQNYVFGQKVLGAFGDLRKIDRRVVILLHDVSKLQLIEVKHAQMRLVFWVLLQQKLNRRLLKRKVHAIGNLDNFVNNQILFIRVVVEGQILFVFELSSVLENTEFLVDADFFDVTLR